MGFREEAIAFKLALPTIDELAIGEYDKIQAKELLSEALILKNMLDPLEENSPANRYQEIKKALAELSKRRSPVGGFRHGRIAFTSFKRTSPAGTEYVVNAVEELPE